MFPSGSRQLSTESQVNPVDVVRGPNPTVFFYEDKVTNDMKTFVLHKLRCSAKKVKILFTKNSLNAALKIFKYSRFSSGLTEWSSFIGCEAHIVVMFFLNKDKNWEFMQMASRAQYKVREAFEAKKM